MTVRPSARPPTRPSAPQGNQFEMLRFLASVGACILILHIHVVFNWQLSKQGISWTVITWPYRGLRCRPLEVTCFFFEVSSFQLIAGSTLIGFLYCNVFSLTGTSPLASDKSIYSSEKYNLHSSPVRRKLGVAFCFFFGGGDEFLVQRFLGISLKAWGVFLVVGGGGVGGGWILSRFPSTPSL